MSLKDTPVFIPFFHEAGKLYPYLKEIDAGRRYFNGGPLLERFESALAEYFGVATATAGLTLNLSAAGHATGGAVGGAQQRGR